MRKVVSIILFAVFSMGMLAVPASREPIVRITADGRMDTVWLHGDEHWSYYGDKPEADEELIRPFKAPQRELRSAYVPSKGTVRIPVVLVNFTDLSFTIADPVGQFDDLFNGNGGSNPHATGSVRTYYEASSNGQLLLEYDVFGPYDLSHEMEYYGANKYNSSGVATNHNIRAKELVTEAAQLAADAGVDFSLYDNDNDGTVDNLSIVVAGYNEAEGGEERTIWPHYSAISNSKSYKGKYLSGYLMISEYRSSGGKVQAGIGTYCHEFGHALGLPDLYDTDNGKNYTVGTWDIMCSGSYNNDGSTPPSYTAFERFVMGWLTPEQICESGMRTLEPIESANTAYLIADAPHNMKPTSPDPSEYFLIENRQCVGWDAGKEALVAPGLLISHITFNQTNWDYNTFNNERPLGFDIVSAGYEQASQSTAADVFPGSTLRTSWVPMFNDGKSLDSLAFSQIRQRGDLCISMQIGGSVDEMLSFETDELVIETTYDAQPVQYDTAQAVLRIQGITQDSLCLTVSSAAFRFSPNQGVQWFSNQDTAWIRVLPDSAYSLPIQVVFLPSRQNCSYSYAYLTAETADGKTGTLTTLAGRSPRPTYITTPVIDTVTNLGSTSFNLLWEPQEDAEEFYYMLYTVSEGESEETETFDHFGSMDSIREHGWDANFVRVQSQVSLSGDAVLFTTTGQLIQTPMYLYAPKAIILWISNNYTPTSAEETPGGTLSLMGSRDGQEWEKAGKLSIQRTTKNVYRTVELDTTRQWRQFRLIYTHTAGNGGVAVDNWSAVFDRDIRYVYKLKDYYIDGSTHEIVFRQLEPATTYYYTMQAYEAKGCDPHYSPLCEPYTVRTRSATDKPQLEVIRTGEGQFDVVFPEAADGQHFLAIYSSTGELFARLRPAYSTGRISLPALPVGELYLLKYYSGSMSRKYIQAKILSY